MTGSRALVFMTKLSIVVGVAWISASVGALAQTLADYNEHAAQSLNITNQQLATAIDSFRGRLHGDRLALFDKSQAAWEVYRRAACKFDGSSVSGSVVQPAVVSACLDTLAKERLGYIQNLGKMDHLTIGSSDRGAAASMGQGEVR
jgi:uncharacterized protein YecT (DUF1311 family)